MKRPGQPQHKTPLRRGTPRSISFEEELRGVIPAVQARAGGRCEAQLQECTERPIQTHHRLRRSQGGGNAIGNLLAVCKSCHQSIHDNPERSYGLGHLLRRYRGQND